MVDLFRQHWTSLSDEPFREPEKNYLLNPITAIAPSGMKHVYDLTIDGEPNFLTVGGIVHNCIDEIDKADKDTLNVLYNVMEDGECRISKAAKRTLKARTSLILPGNPKYQKFDLFADIIDQITIPPALVNRADIVFIMVDSQEHDDEISKHILKTNYYGECVAAGKSEKVTDDQKKDILPPITPKLLKQYIAFAKNNIHPIMNQAAMVKINAYYVKIRGNTTGSSAPVTPRQQQSIIRLSEAMAKMRLSSEVTLADVDAALDIFDKCMEVAVRDPKTGKPDFGRIGQGKSQEKINMLGAMREIIIANPKCSQALLLAKMSERSFKNEHSILAALDGALNAGDISDPGMNSHYIWLGK
jgi:replicative DNA helicase Mcm